MRRERRMFRTLRNGKIRVKTNIRTHVSVCIKVVEDAEGCQISDCEGVHCSWDPVICRLLWQHPKHMDSSLVKNTLKYHCVILQRFNTMKVLLDVPCWLLALLLDLYFLCEISLTLQHHNVLYMGISTDDFSVDQSVIWNQVWHSVLLFCFSFLCCQVLHSHMHRCLGCAQKGPSQSRCIANKGPAISLAHETTYGDV